MTPTPTLALHELHDGGGMPLVLLHPFPLDSRVWKPMAEALPHGVRAIGVDLPGAGKSDIGGLAPSLDLAADAMYTSLTRHGVGNAIVVGCSMGGYAALALAERHPQFVSGLGLVDTKATVDTPAAIKVRQKIAHEVEMSQSLQPVLAILSGLLGVSSLKDRRYLIPTLEGWVHAQLPAGVAWAQRAMARRPDRMHVIEQFAGPIGIVVGAEDKATPPACSEAMAQAAAHSTLTVVPNAGHLALIETPHAVAAALAALHAAVVPHRGRKTDKRARNRLRW